MRRGHWEHTRIQQFIYFCILEEISMLSHIPPKFTFSYHLLVKVCACLFHITQHQQVKN